MNQNAKLYRDLILDACEVTDWNVQDVLWAAVAAYALGRMPRPIKIALIQCVHVAMADEERQKQETPGTN